MNITFSFNSSDDYRGDERPTEFRSESGHVSLDNADYLPKVLDAFLRFLQMAGYTYAERVVVHTDLGEHSSTN